MERGFPVPDPILLVNAQRTVFPVIMQPPTSSPGLGAGTPLSFLQEQNGDWKTALQASKGCTPRWRSDLVPLGHFWVPARRRRVARSLLPVAWCWEHSWAEIPSLSLTEFTCTSAHLVSGWTGRQYIHLRGPACPRRKGYNTALSLQFLHGYSECPGTCPAVMLPRLNSPKRSWWVRSSFLVEVLTGSAVLSSCK